jgi:hypothetical protein
VVAYEGDMSAEDFIAQEDVVVTVTRGGYAKRTKTELYRSQRRGGRGVQGARLKQDDIVEHFFVTTTHHWLLFFTNKGRVYRAKAHELPEADRNARGQHVANILAFQPDEQIAQVIALKDYTARPYLVLATKRGLVKKTALTEYDNGRSSGLIALNLREDDELISAALISSEDDLLLVSRAAQSIRFRADDEALRPMGAATSGVLGMRLAPGVDLLAMQVAPAGGDEETTALLVVTDGGFGKRTKLSEYRVQGRGGSGVLTARIEEKRGELVGALIVGEGDEIFAITSAGVVIRMSVSSLRYLSRPTGGVKLVQLDAGASVVAVAHNGEAEADAEAEAVEAAALAGGAVEPAHRPGGRAGRRSRRQRRGRAAMSQDTTPDAGAPEPPDSRYPGSSPWRSGRAPAGRGCRARSGARPRRRRHGRSLPRLRPPLPPLPRLPRLPRRAQLAPLPAQPPLPARPRRRARPRCRPLLPARCCRRPGARLDLRPPVPSGRRPSPAPAPLGARAAAGHGWSCSASTRGRCSCSA